MVPPPLGYSPTPSYNNSSVAPSTTGSPYGAGSPTLLGTTGGAATAIVMQNQYQKQQHSPRSTVDYADGSSHGDHSTVASSASSRGPAVAVRGNSPPGTGYNPVGAYNKALELLENTVTGTQKAPASPRTLRKAARQRYKISKALKRQEEFETFAQPASATSSPTPRQPGPPMMPSVEVPSASAPIATLTLANQAIVSPRCTAADIAAQEAVAMRQHQQHTPDGATGAAYNPVAAHSRAVELMELEISGSRQSPKDSKALREAAIRRYDIAKEKARHAHANGSAGLEGKATSTRKTANVDNVDTTIRDMMCQMDVDRQMEAEKKALRLVNLLNKGGSDMWS